MELRVARRGLIPSLVLAALLAAAPVASASGASAAPATFVGAPSSSVTPGPVARFATRSSSAAHSAARLPVRIALRDTSVARGRTVVRLLLRTVGADRAREVRVVLRDRSGRRVAAARAVARSTGLGAVTLRAAGRLAPGAYRVTVSGRMGVQGRRATSVQRITLAPAPKVSSAAGAIPDPSRQQAVVDWSGSASAGRGVAGFVVPGIGHGEVVCTPGTQWLRIFPAAQDRETSMMTWTYRSWGSDADQAQKALREALHATGTGRDFNEGFNKFQPSEKQSTGEFIALVSDRGPMGSPFAPSLAPPVGIHVTWAWDFRDPARATCHAQAEVVAQTPDATGVGSAQVLWRGDAAAAGHDRTSVELPGVGRLSIVCEATPSGNRAVTLDTAGASTVTDREASVDVAVPQAAGPVTTELPGNGQLQIDTASGARIVIASRWKVNDPVLGRNSCAVAAQSVAP